MVNGAARIMFCEQCVFVALTEEKRGRERVPNLPAVSLIGLWALMMSILVKYLYCADWLYQSLSYAALNTASL